MFLKRVALTRTNLTKFVCCEEPIHSWASIRVPYRRNIYLNPFKFTDLSLELSILIYWLEIQFLSLYCNGSELLKTNSWDISGKWFEKGKLYLKMQLSIDKALEREG